MMLHHYNDADIMRNMKMMMMTMTTAMGMALSPEGRGYLG